MFEQPQPSGGVVVLEILGGFIVGVITGAAISIGGVVFFMGILGRAGKAGMIVAEIMDLSLLALIGFWALRKMDKSPFRNGFVTGLSIAFVLNAACGITMLR